VKPTIQAPAATPPCLLVSIPFLGHLDPLLRLGGELQRRGWEVVVAAHECMRGHAFRELPGARFESLGASEQF
jgi:UDP:flavonoid glycosyltransferase YjiC (YdhE family)